MIRAPPGGVSIDRKVFIPEGMAVLPRLMSSNVIHSVLPLHNEEFLRHLQQKWVFTLSRVSPRYLPTIPFSRPTAPGGN